MAATTAPSDRPAPFLPEDIIARRRIGASVPTRRRTGRAGHLVVACILDDFSFAAFSREADLAPLTMKNWQVELTAAQPDLLLVESAWRGHRQKWWNSVHHHGPELTGIVEWCKERGIPTAFWNKEDPVHFNTFLTTAGMFDAVFTTDLDCVPLYKKELGHDNIHFLPFAAQTAEANPLETFDRVEGCAFAGAYYEKYPDRLADLAELSTELSAGDQRFDIYDRNYGTDMPGYQFPEEYQSYIVGGALTPDMLDVPYKGYTANLNLNSVKQSQSMFARRVFELMASNTLVISNFSRGLRLMFGDLTITTDSGTEMCRRLERIDAHPYGRERLRAMALRKVLREHTYADRLAFIAEEAGIALGHRDLETVGLIAVLRNEADAARAHQVVAAQTYPNLHLVLLDQRPDLQTSGNDEHVTSFDAALERIRTMGITLIGAIDTRNYYGPNYVLDLVQSLRWADVPAAGHYERFALDAEKAIAAARLNEGTAFTAQPELALTRSLVRSDAFADWIAGCPATPGIDATGPGLAVGVAEYFENGADADTETLACCLPLNIDTGASLETLRTFADQQIIKDSVPPASKTLDIAPLVGSMAPIPSVSVTSDDEGRVLIHSELSAGEYAYVFFLADLPRSALPDDGSPTLYLDTPPGLEFLFVIYYLDEAGKRLAHSFVRPRMNNDITIPEGVGSIRFGLRVSGPGSTVVKHIFLERYDRPRQPLLTRSTTLVATNVYPSYDNLYRNGFVHSRTRSYLDVGQRTDVLRVGPHPDAAFAEFEDLDTAWVDSETFERTLAQGAIRRVLVHFLDRGIWNALRQHPETDQVIVWVHGAEVQPWWRRQYNYSTDAELEAAKPASDARLEFWREVFTMLPDNFHFVFVSQYFADEVFEDVGITLNDSRYSIIHNPIDTEIFDYVAKTDEQRRKVLTIRPYASPKYANDLSAAAILSLKDRPGFEDIEFRVIGDGALFDEVLEPLRTLPNVTIERGFLTHSEIAALHKDYGVFLTPTRMDAQGVSRDEAMSSGLVPISTNVAAIPEFVDDSCGFLAPPEDHQELAEAIWKLAHDSELFQRLSRSAADRVRQQTASSVILPQELSLIFGDADDAE